MKFLFKILIAFLIIFNWRTPYLYNSVFWSLFITTAYYLIYKKTIPFTYFFQRYNVVVLMGTVAIAFVLFIITLIHNTEIMSDLQKRMWVVLLMVGAVIYALPLFVEGKKSSSFEEISVIICYAFAFQGLIHLVAFLYAPLGNYLFEMKPENLKEAVLNPSRNIDKWRMYCLSGIVFVELVAGYGVAFMLFFRLQLNSISHPHLKGWLQYIVLFFIFIGTMLAGRTGFIGFGLGFFLWIYFAFNRFIIFVKRNFLYLIGVLGVVYIVFTFLLTPVQREIFKSEVFPFAFEGFYNYIDYGEFSMGSLEGTVSHYYPLRDETLLIGHGSFDRVMIQYPHSDAGYINTLIFGGIPYLVCLIIYQSLYFIGPILLALRKNIFSNRADIALFLLFFLYMFLLTYKTTAMGSLHIVEALFVAAGSAYVIRYYSSEDQKEQLE